jgi:hypothetical protein
MSGRGAVMDDRLEVTCPCCSTRLTIDPATGEILGEERPPADHGKSFEDAMSTVQGGAQRREDAFAKAYNRTQNLDDLLQKKFEEARKKAAKDKSDKPRNPFDLD